MNKIKGSYVWKTVAWILFLAAAAGAVFFYVVITECFNYGMYSGTSAGEVSEAMFENLNSSYSIEVYNNLINNGNGNPQTMLENGFRYGIIEAENIDDIDLNLETNYIESNFFIGDSQPEIDRQSLYVYKVDVYDNWESIGYFTGKNYWQNKKMEATGETTSSEVVSGDWKGLYADAVCYDEAGGIFYYRAESNYYPIQNVKIYFNKMEYSYTYDFNKAEYKLNYASHSEVEDEAYGDYIDVDAIENALYGTGAGSYFKFNELYSLNFSCDMWGILCMDNIRAIEGSELTKINSENISKSRFIKKAGYYLNEDYTLIVEDTSEKATTYWVLSELPATITTDLNGNMYDRLQWLVYTLYELRYSAIFLAILLTAVALLAFVFLACSAGHRKNTEEIIFMAFPDKIPFDVWSLVMLIMAAIPLGLGIEVAADSAFRSSPAVMIVIIAVCVISFLCLVNWYVLGFCTRVKYGKWWRNTICYKIYSFIRNILIKLYRNISLLWKFIIIAAALMFMKWIVLIGFGRNVLVVFSSLTNAIIFIIIMWLIVQFGELQKASQKMAEGDLAYKADTSKMFFEFRKHGENLNKISEGMSKAVEERIKSEHFKTELITNVSHDIKTPLTSIINYVDLLEKEELNNEKATEYLEVLERQSSKLKKLIEDLVEASKASSGSLSVNNEKLEAGVFITQTVGEFEEKLSAAGLELIVNKPQEPVYIMADGRHLWRVVDNLMNNICKYAQPMSRVYVSLDADKEVKIIFRNISKYPLNVTGEELLERFVRGDKSRNTEGHGLGLSIAQSLVNLMGGRMNITVDGDLFKVVIEFERCMP